MSSPVRVLACAGCGVALSPGDLACEGCGTPVVTARAEVVCGTRWSRGSRYVERPELEGVLREALLSGRGAVVVGEGGMGKTRLVHHVLKDRQLVGTSAARSLRPTATVLCAQLLEQVPGAPPALLRLLRGGGSGGQSEESMQLRAAGAQLAELCPGGVVLVDDLERLPEPDTELLLEAVRASGLPWVFACRESRPRIGLAEVRVMPWTTAEAEVLLEEILPLASAELRQAVLARAGDCPLYLEQCAGLLLENGAVEVDAQGTHLLQPQLLREIPSSMRLFVSGRLDLLPTDQRAVLSIAAVLGAEPDVALLDHLSGGPSHVVEALLESGLLQWAPGLAGQPELRFSHALVRDVAYETLAPGRRVEIHRAAAEWYAVLPVSQVLESQAYHLESAVHLEEPDCDLLRRTVAAMVLFARSVEEERTRISREVLGRARVLAESRAECNVDVLALELATASVEFLAGEQSASGKAAERALALGRELQDLRAESEARLHLARAYRYVDNARARAELDLAEAVYTHITDRAGLARVEIERGMLAEHDEGLVQYLSYLERAYIEAMRSADTRLQASCAQWLAMHTAFAYGREAFEEWSSRAREVSRRDDLGLEPRMDLASAGIAMFELDPGAGLDSGLRAMTAGRELGLEHVYSNALIATIDLLLLSGALHQAQNVLEEARGSARRRPTPWLSLQHDLLEARLLQRQGCVPEAVALLDGVAGHDLAEHRVLRRDLAEARAWVALERGRFGEAGALAAEAVAVDAEMGERCAPMRPRLVDLVATVASGQTVPLGTIAALRAKARETGLGTIAQLANRWLYVDELSRGWTVDLHGLQDCEAVEARALDLEIEALSSRQWPLLLEAAAVWAELGTTVWHARALLWHSELTGTSSPEADELLSTLQSPDGLAEILRAQVRSLRG